MKLKLLALTTIVIVSLTSSHAQNYFGDRFRIKSYTHYDKSYTLYDFSRAGNSSTNLKAKYFATNAYQQYLNWKGNKEILLVTAGAFSDTFKSDAIPVGLCVDNGYIVNRSADGVMDGMVVIYNGAAQVGGVAVVDLDKKAVKVEAPFGSGNYEYYYPRSISADANQFLEWGEQAGVTLFQTQLVYSEKKTSTENFSNLYYGNERERRFLALCMKNSVVHHVVIDAPDMQYLMKGTKNVKEVLEYDGFEVLYILNLDTGGKNVLHVYDGNGLQDMQPYKGTVAGHGKIENSTNLLVYYKD